MLSIATAVPPYQLDQRAIAVVAREVYARTFTRYPKLADVFVNAGIERPYSARPLEWLSIEGASELFIQTAKAAWQLLPIRGQDDSYAPSRGPVSGSGIKRP